MNLKYPPPMDFYRKSINQIFKDLKTSKKGLTSNEVHLRFSRNGPNELASRKTNTLLNILTSQIKSPLVFVLIFAGLITFFLGDTVDSIVIFLAVIINTSVGFVQEFKAQKDLESLKKLVVPHAIVLRDGRKIKIEARNIVVGDIIYLKSGRSVPADARIISQGRSLKVNEASLTGESLPVSKYFFTLKKSLPLGDQSNMVFWGTQVVSGYLKAVVVRTGLDTEIGKISSSLSKIVDLKTPLQKKLAEISKKLTLVVFVVSATLFFIGLASGKDFLEMFATSVAVAVSAIPEGLLIALTVILALGMHKMYKVKALVRKMVSAETLGSVNFICADKTGTLTRGEMVVTGWLLLNEDMALKNISLCNDFINPTDHALWNKAKSISYFSPDKVRSYIKRLASISFSSNIKYMATLHKSRQVYGREKKNSKYVIFAKGAPEIIFTMCKMSAATEKKYMEIVERWAKDGKRVLALSKKDIVFGARGSLKLLLDTKVVGNQKLLGLLALDDPIRKDVGYALKKAKLAGIQTIVITGDYKATALRVMQKIGLKFKSEREMDGQDMKSLSDEDFKLKLENIRLFSRVTSFDKLRIVEALQDKGHVVAMTGDGVNDAPALKKADIGIVVGSATEVAKETADMILLDSNFKTIVLAIEEGRKIYFRLKTVILYLLSDSFAEVVLIAGAIFLGLPLPILATQILWVNLIDDGFPSLALTIEKGDANVMKQKPIKPTQGLIDFKIKTLIAAISVVVGIFSILMFKLITSGTGDLGLARSTVFTLMGVSSLLYVYSCKSLTKPIWAVKVFDNKYLNTAVALGLVAQISAIYLPFLQRLLHTKPLGITQWLYVAITSIVIIIIIEFIKLIFLKFKGRD